MTDDNKELEKLEEKLEKLESARNSIFNSFDLGGLLLAATGNDPLFGFGVAKFGEVIKDLRERSRENKAGRIRRQINKIERTNTSSPLSAGVSAGASEVDTLANQELKRTADNTEEMVNIFKEGRKFQEKVRQEEKARASAARLKGIENRREGQLLLPAPAGYSDNEDGEKKQQSFLKGAFQGITNIISKGVGAVGSGLGAAGGLLGGQGILAALGSGKGLLKSLGRGAVGLGKQGLKFGARLLSIKGVILTFLFAETLNFVREMFQGKKGNETRLGKMIVGLDRSIYNMFTKLGPNADMGATMGSIVPLVGTLAGGLIGLAIDGVIAGFKLLKLGGGAMLQGLVEMDSSVAKFMGDNYGTTAGEYAESWGQSVPIAGSIVGGLFGLVLETSMLAVKGMASGAKKIASLVGVGLSKLFDSFKRLIFSFYASILDGTSDISKRYLGGRGTETISAMKRKIANILGVEDQPQKQTQAPQQTKSGQKRVSKRQRNIQRRDSRREKKMARQESYAGGSLVRVSSETPSRNISGNLGEKLLRNALDKAGIVDPTERAAFLAQMAHESNNFTELVERASGQAYEGKKILGNTQKGDGPRFKGRGFTQLTGRWNYQHYGNMIGVDLISNPDLAADPKIAAELAVAYWKDRVQPNVRDFSNVAQVTKPINNGLNNLDDRKRKFAKFAAADPRVRVASNNLGGNAISPSTVNIPGANNNVGKTLTGAQGSLDNTVASIASSDFTGKLAGVFNQVNQLTPQNSQGMARGPQGTSSATDLLLKQMKL